MDSRGFSRALVAGLCLIATFAGACGGGGDTPADEVEAVITELQKRFAAGDLRNVCAGMTPAARQRATHSAGLAGCADGLRRLLPLDRRRPSTVRSATRDVIGVRVVGGRATARVALHDRVPGSLDLVEQAGEWKLDGLAVRPIPRRSTWDTATIAGERFSSFRVRKGRRVPCRNTRYVPGRTAGEGAIAGGCVLTLSTDSAPFILLTAFGDFEIARCDGRFRLHVDNVNVLGQGVEFAASPSCEDVAHCRNGETGLTYPWQGEKLPSSPDVVLLRIDICVNTPAGRVRGLQLTELRRRHGDWTADPVDYPVGDRSVQIGGRWDVDPDDFRFGPPAAAY